MLKLPSIQLPKPVPQEHIRQPQQNIPQTREEREAVKRFAKAYVQRVKPVTPLSMAELKGHAEILTKELGFADKYIDYVGVVLNNEAWTPTLAGIPFERRMLLLPKCLRVEDRCPAPFDDFGLLCKQCGLCTIQDLQSEAERLGYAVLVAEGSALVMALIQTGKIDAIVGVSCLNVLERAFPYMEAAAVPGVAIPLLQDDCKNTSVDMDWIWDIIHLSSEDKTYRLDLDGLRETVDSWFNAETLNEHLGEPEGEADILAREWLIQDGKRWRPFLTVCAWHALAEDTSVISDDVKRIAIAVECFHKASLIHDDIEDSDATRYGERTMHARFGIPVALNVGDLLLGEGYRLLAGCGASPDVISRMMRIAASGHRQLCVGQGAELAWASKPAPMTALDVLAIFRQKTSPAFSVALRLGAAFAGADKTTDDVLIAFSDALGTAYQIKDDIGDFEAGTDPDDINAQRLSVLLALAHDRPKGAANPVLQAAFRRDASLDANAIREAIVAEDAPDRARRLMEGYKEEAVRTLAGLESASLKGLLRRVVSKIFRVQIEGWCGEFETRNATDSTSGTEGPR